MGRSKTLLRYDGQIWADERLPIYEAIHFRSIWGVSSSDIFVVGSQGAILHYTGAPR